MLINYSREQLKSILDGYCLFTPVFADKLLVSRG